MNSIFDIFVKNDWDHLHDIWLHVHTSKPSREELEEMFNSLPKHLQELAEEWGCNDTVFKDDTIIYLRNEHE